MKPTPLTCLDISKQKNAVPYDHCISCTQSWSFAQMEAIKRLSVQEKCFLTGKKKWKLVSDFSVRAARIAGNYARFYLELEAGGQPKQKGRFYWMGLAAIASKQVKCGLDFAASASTLSTFTVAVANAPLYVGKNGLGKGNFWLFQDIFCWHWFYNKCPDEFATCSSLRDVNSLEPQVQKHIKELPWSEDALVAVNNLKETAEVKEAFTLIRELESLPPGPDRESAKYKSLLRIADHEQLKILQPLIYDDWTFQKILDGQAIAEGVPYVPLRSAAFSVSCDVEQAENRVQMTKGDLYNARDRMSFIGEIAKQYHYLMRSDTKRMESVITEIAGWSNME
ncbi:hypothetical protein [Pseudomonas purpurea]|uniref:DUF2515 family protein n=1 Tax=Pseudomonas purpurea TaxID=3136737 RepID=UPI0032641194